MASAIERFEQKMQLLGGCTDHGCIIKRPPPGAMGTNGGCKCYMDKIKMQHFAYAVRELRDALGADEELLKSWCKPSSSSDKV